MKQHTPFEWRTGALTAEKDMGESDTVDEVLDDAGVLIDHLEELVRQFSTSSEALLSQMSLLRGQLEYLNSIKSTSSNLTILPPPPNLPTSSNSRD